ncbi:hypothetical protein GXM_10056 [Nostoc sphaeroides CCNUC1]|uniref:Uncharacterized protein n=1 Tax=Nostoc sphaeroides CCNUC1 TaxID=2653204 RepID=A0A5P8WK15_9NOSO|nr:hypothetical protein GXM_10056 [Nostoc sphaeroides CCNUC1]
MSWVTKNKLMYLDFSQDIDQPKSTTGVVLLNQALTKLKQ